MHAQHWHLPQLHLPRPLRAEHVQRALFALLATAFAAGCAQLAVAQPNPLHDLQAFATQPYWWFVENVVAYASYGFTR